MKKSFWMVLWVATGLSACAHHQASSPADPPRRATRRPPPPELCHTVEVERPIDTAAACPKWRWIGVMSDSQDRCPELASGAGAPEPLFGSQPLPPALRPFCVYEFSQRGDALGSAVEELQALVRGGSLERVDSSCMALSPAAEPQDSDGGQAEALSLGSLMFTDLQEHLFAQAGRTELSGNSAPGARLAFLDTQPTYGGMSMERGRSEHGYSLAQLARQLACNGSCTAKITTRLALPIYGFDREDASNTLRDPEAGGYFGSIDDLARAIQDEVEDWRQSYTPPRLVLNLSVAWDGELFGGLENRYSRMPAGVQAVYRALEVAACRDVLVIAAAGNRRGGPDEDPGPLLPAAWERRDAPDEAACVAALGEAPPDSPPAPRPSRRGHPLIYAVGGVTSDGSSLVNARSRGTPPLVAYGDHAVARDHGGSPTATLTGTSVSTAIVSTTAAAVWHYRPELGRHELMDLVYKSGEDLGRRADFHHRSRSTVPTVRRVSLCSALNRACAAGEGSCPYTMPPCPPWSQEPPSLSLHQFQGERFGASALNEDLGANQLCSTQKNLYDPVRGLPTQPCPYRQFYGITSRPWTGPQPQVIPCPSCTIREDGGEGGAGSDAGATLTALTGAGSPSGPMVQAPQLQTTASYTLYVKIRDDWPEDLALFNVSLGIGDTGYTLSQALDGKTLKQGQTAKIEGIELKGPRLTPGVPVVLWFNTKEGSIENPVLLVE